MGAIVHMIYRWVDTWWEPYAVKAGSATTTALPPIPMHCATIIALLTSLYTQCYSGAPPLSVNELKPGAVAGVGASVILSQSATDRPPVNISSDSPSVNILKDCPLLDIVHTPRAWFDIEQVKVKRYKPQN